jgi:hypothetical protein
MESTASHRHRTALAAAAVVSLRTLMQEFGEFAAGVAGVVVAMQIHRKPTLKAPIYLTGVVTWLRGLGCPISPL